MERNPIRNDARRARRTQALGPATACARCGITTPDALIAADRTLLDAHHVCGRANDGHLTVPLCRNCHAILTEGQRTAGVSFTPAPTILDRLAAILIALAAFLADLAARCSVWSDALIALRRGLDDAYPEWRELPTAGCPDGWA